MRVSRELNVIYGRPGSGKTSVIQTLQDEVPHGFSYLSIGSLSRQEEQDGTALGGRLLSYQRTVREYPKCLIKKLVEKGLTETEAQTIVIDGFPKWPRELEVFEDVMAANSDIRIGSVIELTIGLHQAMDRVAKRKICNQCDAQGEFETQCPYCLSSDIATRHDDEQTSFLRRSMDYNETIPHIIRTLELGGFAYHRIMADQQLEVVAEQVRSILLKSNVLVQSSV